MLLLLSLLGTGVYSVPLYVRLSEHEDLIPNPNSSLQLVASKSYKAKNEKPRPGVTKRKLQEAEEM